MPEEAPVTTTGAWLLGFGRLMMISPVDSAGGPHERLASRVEIRCAAVGFISLGRRRIVEHAERAVAHPVHNGRVDGVSDRGELPETVSWPAGACARSHR